MKKIIQLIGGAFVAAILVIAVTVIYQNQIIPRLKTDAFKNTEKEMDFRDERAFYEAVSYHPVFEYTGGTAQKTVIAYDENNQATAASVEYSVLKDICVTDKKDDYEKTLAEAVEENRIRNIEVTVSTPDKEATSDASDKGYQLEVLDSLDGDEAGIKSITFQISGENAYGYLKSEKGVHRLVRISPFNAAGKRQTSFVSCDVMPDIEDNIDIEIADDDIRIDTYRSSGAGGQHINKTSSAIRITHLPTGIVVQCQNERSQHMNKDKAMQMLKAKLYLLKQEENAKKAADIRGDVTEIGWGNQIRSYVLQPYTMVKDHRTNEETGNADSVLDGKIDIFINAYLKYVAQKGVK